MNVKTLNQFLQNLVAPLQASRASDEIVSDLNQITQALTQFSDKPISELAAFLRRSQEYERQGHWPEAAPPIEGALVDKPSPQEYADRLQAYLRKEVPAEGAMPIAVTVELDGLKKAMTAAQLKEMASACGVPGSVSSGPAAIQKTFEHVTGRKLADAVVGAYAGYLQQSVSEADLDSRLNEINALPVSQIKSIAKQIGVKDKVSAKGDGIRKIKAQLQSSAEPQTGESSLFASEPAPAAYSQDKIDRVVETLRALKEKADPEGAPYDEIEAELDRLTEGLTAPEAMAAAKQFEVRGTVTSKIEAIKRMREKVFEREIIREQIRH